MSKPISLIQKPIPNTGLYQISGIGISSTCGEYINQKITSSLLYHPHTKKHPPMWQFIKWHTRGWTRFFIDYNKYIIYKLGSGVGLSQNFRHSPSLQIGGDIEGEFWMWRSDNWHKTPYEMCHLPNCHNTSCGSHVLVLVWIYLSELPQSIPSIMIMFSRTYLISMCMYIW